MDSLLSYILCILNNNNNNNNNNNLNNESFERAKIYQPTDDIPFAGKKTKVKTKANMENGYNLGN